MDIFRHLATSKLSLNSLRLWLYIYSCIDDSFVNDSALFDSSDCCNELKISELTLSKAIHELKENNLVFVDDSVHPLFSQITLNHLHTFQISDSLKKKYDLYLAKFK